MKKFYVKKTIIIKGALKQSNAILLLKMSLRNKSEPFVEFIRVKLIF